MLAAVRTEPLFHVGVLEGVECAVFGRVVDAVFDRDGRLYVLDGQAHRVSVFDRDGRCAGTIGRRGEGPGEFMLPSGLLMDDEGLLHVLARGRIETFDIASGEPRRVGSRPAPAQPVDLCLIGGRLFVAAIGDPIIHPIGETGTDGNSFGRLHDGDPSAMTIIAKPGQMACDPGSRMLVVAAHQLGTVHRYSADGELIGAGAVPGFREIQLMRNGGEIVGYRPSPDGVDYAAAAHRISGPSVLLQVGQRVEGSFRSTRWFRLDLETGVIEPVGEQLPHIFDIRGDRIVVSSNVDHPRLAIHALPRDGG